jgi:hypothetical protein
MFDQESRNKLFKLMGKEAYVPPAPPMDPSMMGGAPPMDPAMMGGAPPMDPSMMGGAPPMDPAMMGGAPPMDPAMMGGAPPMDPSMMGMVGGPPPMPADMDMPVMLNMDDLKAVLEETVNQRVSRVEGLVEAIAKRMGVDVEKAAPAETPKDENELPPYLQIPEAEGMTDEAVAAAQQPASQDVQSLQGTIGALQGA